jgi:type III restriction enzyme
MKFTLKDYQDDAVADVLVNLTKAKKRWHEDQDLHAFSLAATTGAGKTVMAAAVFEALFYGEDSYNFEADSSSVVIWFSDDPSLNEQTRFRLMEASDKLKHSDLVVVDNNFRQEKLEAGKIYFLNTQKLGKKSLLVRGFDERIEANANQIELFVAPAPDLRSHTIWDVIQNTIEDPNLTLYLVLDEAHRGMGKVTANAKKEKSTLVHRLINGTGSVSPVPVVVGISATVERFNAAMKKAEGRSTLPNVVVDNTKVQASGLLKDNIILDIPEQVGKFDGVLVRRATNKIKASSNAWREYALEQGHKESEAVKPLMVLQVPNKPEASDIGKTLDVIFENWDEIRPPNIAHVFGERKDLTFGPHYVPYIEPQRVQETKEIRVLIAKDAISTGWDCPRAEVMVSFRPARDKTHITQLLGRMVRTPLAMRIPGNDKLNSVDCLLPFFDHKSVEEVVQAIRFGTSEMDDSPLPGRRVLINPIEVLPNPSINEDVWHKFSSLPSQSLPKKVSKPIKRLTALSHELAFDNLLPNAGQTAHAEMFKIFGAAKVRYNNQFKDSVKQVLQVEGETLNADLASGNNTFSSFVENADPTVIRSEFQSACRILSKDICKSYVKNLVELGDEEPTDAIYAAYTVISALSKVEDIVTYIEDEATKLIQNWFTKYRVDIKGLKDDRKEVYRQIKELSSDPQDIDLVKPRGWLVNSSSLEENGKEKSIPTYLSHLLCSDEGEFPTELNLWEQAVVETEMSRNGFVGWYRNPSSGNVESLGITYLEGNKFKILRPDFVFFSKNSDGNIVVDIVDPHGTHLSDALPKLKGLANYALEHGEHFRRIESCALVGKNLRVIDLKEAKVRSAIDFSEDAKSLFESSLAYDLV